MLDKIDVKSIILGNTAVGKTSFISAISETPTELIRDVTKFEIEGTDYVLNLFDTAGQEEFRALAISYYRNAQVFIFVTTCDANTQEEDDKSLIEFISNAREYAGDSFNAIFLLNKTDLLDDHRLLDNRIDALRNFLKEYAGISQNVTLIPISCLTRDGILDAWYAINDIVTNMDPPPPEPPQPTLKDDPDPNRCNC